MSSRFAAADDDEPYVAMLKPNDVLFGRGSGPNYHGGNILFRSLVKERKSAYMATNHRQTKAKIAKEIVDAIRARRGRFLKKLDAKECNRLGLDDETDVWKRVDEKTIMEKAKQALRQKEELNKDHDEEQLAPLDSYVSSTVDINNVPPSYEVPLEMLSDFAHPMDPLILPDVYGSGDMPLQYGQENQEPLDWRSYGGNSDDMAAYLQQPNGASAVLEEISCWRSDTAFEE